MGTIRHVVFDIGNVLLQWDPHLAFLPELGSRAAVDAFLARIDFHRWNRLCDGGEDRAALTAAIADPQDRAVLTRYAARFAQTIAQPVPGSWDILDDLVARGVPVGAITNFSADMWPHALALYPALGTALDPVVVSGAERLLKPEPAIFHLFCRRAGVAPADCLFIDDSPDNVAGARAVGMQAVHFTDAPALRGELESAGLL